MGIGEMSIGKLIITGGPAMIPIILCSILVIAITAAKWWYFSSITAGTEKLKSEITDDIKNNKIKEAVIRCDQHPAPLAKIFKAGILSFGTSRGEIKEAMEDASQFEIPRVESRLSALSTIANISPLLGLVGTVSGIMKSFHAISVRAGSSSPVSPGELVGGIGEALIATLAGLIVAITAFIAYNYCVSRAKQIILNMERSATELLIFLSQISESGHTPKGDH